VPDENTSLSDELLRLPTVVLPLKIDAAKHHISVIEDCEVVPHAETVPCPGVAYRRFFPCIHPVAEHIGFEKDPRIDFYHIIVLLNSLLHPPTSFPFLHSSMPDGSREDN
jgi:hypothetical protein